MMKHILSITTMLFMTIVGFSQTTITNSTFFGIGDILYTSTDDIPNISLGAIGGNNTWDYTSLSSAQLDATEVFSAASGMGAASFPNADVYINFGGGELYLEINANNIKQVGFIGAFMGFDVNTAFNPQGNFKFAPISYGDTFTDTNGFGFTIGADQLPFLDDLGLPINPDSIRITQIFNTAYEADAWGTMTIPNGTYDVLRLKRLQTTDTQIEAYVPFLGWIDVTGFIGDDLPIPGGGAGTVESYEFLADGIKESIATVQMDTVGGDIVSVTYKAQDTGTTAIVDAGSETTVFSAYPNPAYNDVRIDIRGFDNGVYNLDLFNIAGKLMMSKEITINRDTAATINVARLNKGTYLYTLKNEDGETLKARRLMVVKP